jgi:hypothetical protein
MLSKIFYLKAPGVTLVQQTDEQDRPLLDHWQLHSDTTTPRDPDETLRDMFGYTLWNILQDSVHFIS